jgi:hypothetical protein
MIGFSKNRSPYLINLAFKKYVEIFCLLPLNEVEDKFRDLRSRYKDTIRWSFIVL